MITNPSDLSDEKLLELVQSVADPNTPVIHGMKFGDLVAEMTKRLADLRCLSQNPPSCPESGEEL